MMNSEINDQNDLDERTPLCEDEFGGYVTNARPAATKVTLRLCLAVFSAVMGSIEFGYNTGVINAPETEIKAFINVTHYNRTGKPMTDVLITSLFAVTVAIFAVGGMIGGVSAGWWADYFGRRYGMIINNIIGIAACLMMYLSRRATSYEMIIIGRLLVGFSCGLFTGLTPMYLSEIASSSNRGALGTLHQLGVVVGLLISQVLGFPEILGNVDYWNLLLGLGLVPCVIQLFTMPMCPETPRFLLLRKNREMQSRRALEHLRGTTDVDFEIEEMKAEKRTNMEEESVNIPGLFKKRSLRKPLFISIAMHLSQQLSGINAGHTGHSFRRSGGSNAAAVEDSSQKRWINMAVSLSLIFYYSFNLFKQAGLENTSAAHATSGVGSTMIVMTIITIPLMDRTGRRTLHLIGLGGMFIFSILITLSLALSYLAEWLKVLTVAMALLYVVSFAAGPGSIPWLIVSELFAQGSRPAAMSISVLVNWIANFAVGFCFPYMQSGLQEYSFLPFTGFLGLFLIFTVKYVPETKNRTINDITQLWDEDRRKEEQIAKYEEEESENADV